MHTNVQKETTKEMLHKYPASPVRPLPQAAHPRAPHSLSGTPRSPIRPRHCSPSPSAPQRTAPRSHPPRFTPRLTAAPLTSALTPAPALPHNRQPRARLPRSNGVEALRIPPRLLPSALPLRGQQPVGGKAGNARGNGSPGEPGPVPPPRPRAAGPPQRERDSLSSWPRRRPKPAPHAAEHPLVTVGKASGAAA
ncbi:uncharacterized protein LOC134151818 [Rhea pennata]|uniref:uncharacterized protein LOC134151818 n=1 Tax=Rhea pennata TaxID=8795 RepID=UPI002E25EC86